ncbi:peptidoglycan-binding protein [Streptomyces sp. NPDC059010]|uniref:peptidoglycan-binding domain-containing protein n=1 Tax=Streptomyces sp. NPDC059010 TaxID=3346695 RepID=UPI0036B24771
MTTMTMRQRITTGLVSAAFLGGTLVAVAPAASAAPATAPAASSAGVSAAPNCPMTTGIGYYCGYYKGTAYTDFGDRGNKVKEIQALIKASHYSGRLAIDGDFGNDTLKAVKWYQKRWMGDSTPDGKVGPITWKSLRWDCAC